MKVQFKAVLLLVLGLLAGACGNLQHTPDLALIAKGSSITSMGGYQYLPQYMQCSESANLLSYRGSHVDYRGCRSTSNSAAIKLYPTLGSDTNVCVFAISRGGPVIQNPYAPEAYRFVKQCLLVSGSGSETTLSGAAFDQVLVVEQSRADWISHCMAIAPGNVQGCADSYGIDFAQGSL
jgi:hypothetical protein